MIKLKFKDIHSNPYVLYELILTAKIMRKKNFKIQMLAGNRFKIPVDASSQISKYDFRRCHTLTDLRTDYKRHR